MQDNLYLTKLDNFFIESKLSSYQKRTLVLQPNDSPSSVFYIKSGYIRVFRISEEGEELTLTILKPQDVFPLTYGMNNIINPYYLETITPLEVWRAPQEKFLQFIKSDPEIFYALTNRIMVRFDGVLSRMECLVFSNAYIKVATTIMVCAKRFGEPYGEDIRIKVPLTHHDLATLIGITRETTSLEMKKLEREGFVGRLGRLLLVKNIKQLEDQLFLFSQEGSFLAYSL